ncbi:AAA family ATPase [Nitrosospira briensis]|uniref:AAA family ATPase n=1 Tax=Nitrosospira briensis TaxID=35799 RepID=UPI0008EE884E|nr:AAA family ATPase [Nitrosospira briensis]SFO33667.1 AAA ATPase domain-containing protein [Nitrosospira briensis]
MHLKSFKVTNFRSINDSGSIDISQITAVLGRNESGKSNLLRALHSLNPAEGFAALNPTKDFPRHRRLGECMATTPVVFTRWSLDDDEQVELAEILPRATGVSHVSISRRYDAIRCIDFEGLAVQKFDEIDIKSKLRKIVPAVKAAADRIGETEKVQLERAADLFDVAMAFVPDRVKWSESAVIALQTLRKALASADTDLSDKHERLIFELEDISSSIANDKEDQARARRWVLERMPKFIYVDEYPELHGHQNVAEYVGRRGQPTTMTTPDYNFEKLCKVAGLDPQELENLLAQGEQEKRNLLVNRAGAVVTSEIRRLWKDRVLKVRFNLDSHHLDTLISDPNAIYDVEVNLNERSRGFQWFFSFYITFFADTKGGKAEDAILLLDEPGLYLHAKSQSDLLGHFKRDFENQIIYTTHSPFMVPTHALDSIRTVSIDESAGTTVTNNPAGDARTLFPLQAALGYNIAQSLFIGPNNLVVEGVTDFWVLSSVSSYFAEIGRIALHPELTVTPAGGAQKVSYMVALLSSEELNVLVLLDHERDAQMTKDDLVKNKLVLDQNVVFVSEAFGATAPKEADIEDLLDPTMYEVLVRESYAKELAGKTLKLNADIPRIAKRCELALKVLDIEFHKTRPTRLMIKKMSTDPTAILTENSAKQFEALFKTVNERLQKHINRSIKPF